MTLTNATAVQPQFVGFRLETPAAVVTLVGRHQPSDISYSDRHFQNRRGKSLELL